MVKVPPRKSVAAFANANSARKTLCCINFDQVNRRARVCWCHILGIWTLKNLPRILLSVGSVMILAAISYKRRTNLVRFQGNLTAQRYRGFILQHLMLNVIEQQRKMFHQNNAWLHKARVTMDFLT